jgi:Holliday junction resolvase
MEIPQQFEKISYNIFEGGLMPVYSKIKGNIFEREAVNMLTELIPGSKWKRVPTSGAIGTRMEIPLLFSDLIGEIKDFPKRMRGEAKAGYGGAKQFTLKKEWLDKILMEAKNTYSVPFLIGKFSGARDGSRVFVALDVHVFATLVNQITDLQRRLDEETEKVEHYQKEPL